ncbi:MAG: hypothetical protein V4717_11450 [Bacteroidota bacterium]
MHFLILPLPGEHARITTISMKAATAQEIKKQLNTMPASELVDLCQRLARFKKENKELLSYLLFNAQDEEQFVLDIKEEIGQLFSEINTSHMYYAKKSLRKILKIINKYCRYSSVTETEIILRIHFCVSLKESGISLRRDKVITKMYQMQFTKIKDLVSTLHEDLQYDFRHGMAELEL